jgi:hypothetical protein
MCIVQRPYIKDSIGARPNMTSVFDFDDSINTAFNAKTAGKNLVTAKHEVLTKAGDFLFLAHSDKEFALRCQMMEADIESAARRKMASVSDSKFKLVRALHEEWKIRHANCSTCKLAEVNEPSIHEILNNLDKSGIHDLEAKWTPVREMLGWEGEGRPDHDNWSVHPEGHRLTGDTVYLESPRGSLCDYAIQVNPDGSWAHGAHGRGGPHFVQTGQSDSVEQAKKDVVSSFLKRYPDMSEELSRTRISSRKTAHEKDWSFQGEESNLTGQDLVEHVRREHPGVLPILGPNFEPGEDRRTLRERHDDLHAQGDLSHSHSGPASPRPVEIIRSTECPACGAGVGDSCKTRNMNSGQGYGLHIERRMLHRQRAAEGTLPTELAPRPRRSREPSQSSLEFTSEPFDLTEFLSRPEASKSSVQNKISSLKVRVAFPFEVDKGSGADYSIGSNLGKGVAQALAAKYADRRADLPEMQSEAKCGRWALITKHDGEGRVVDATLGRIGGSELGGEAETSPLICTGNTHHGTSHGPDRPCEHSATDAFGGRHIGLQETPLDIVKGGEHAGTIIPDLGSRSEGSIFAPSSRVHILPQENHDLIELLMNGVAEGGAEHLGIPAYKREEEGRGKPIETFGRGHETSETGPGINTEMGESHGVGKVSNFTIYPSTATHGFYENQRSKGRMGGDEGTAEMLESGPRNRTEAWSKGGPGTKLIPGQNGKGGSGRVLPVATMVPMYNATDAAKGMSGALPDGTSAGMGVTPRLRPVAWGNVSDAPTFKFLPGQKMKAVGEALRQKLTKLNDERKQRVSSEAQEKAKTSPSTRPTKKNKAQDFSVDLLTKLMGQK